MAEERDMCTACDHSFHIRRCFRTDLIGRNYIQCRCKKGVRKSE